MKVRKGVVTHCLAAPRSIIVVLILQQPPRRLELNLGFALHIKKYKAEEDVVDQRIIIM